MNVRTTIHLRARDIDDAKVVMCGAKTSMPFPSIDLLDATGDPTIVFLLTSTEPVSEFVESLRELANRLELLTDPKLRVQHNDVKDCWHTGEARSRCMEGRHHAASS